MCDEKKNNLKNYSKKPIKNSLKPQPINCNNFNNYYLGEEYDETCNCHFDLNYPQENYLKKNPTKTFLDEYNTPCCMRKLLCNDKFLSKNEKHNLLWLNIKDPKEEDIILYIHFKEKLKSSLDLRRDIGLTKVKNLDSLENNLKFISILVDECILFYSTIDLTLYESYNKAILDFFKNGKTLYKKNFTNLDYFAENVNPIISHNLKYTRSFDFCLSGKRLEHINKKKLKKDEFEDLLKQKDYLKNNIQRKVIIIPFLEQEMTKFENFKKLGKIYKDEE